MVYSTSKRINKSMGKNYIYPPSYFETNSQYNTIIYDDECNIEGVIYFDLFVKYTNYKDTLNNCIYTIINYLINKYNYIGATHNLEDRLWYHMHNKGMNNMIVLTYAPTKNISIRLEKDLIKYFKKVNNLNQSGGGEGIKYENNFIYVMLP